MVKDLGSANGTFISGQQIIEAEITERTALQLGIDGPIMWLEPLHSRLEQIPSKPPLAVPDPSIDATRVAVSARPPSEGKDLSKEQLIQHYLGDEPVGPMGDRTMFVRQAFKQAQTQQKKRFSIVIGVIASLLILVAGLAAYQQSRLSNARELAIEMFYDMKELEVQVAKTESRVRKTGSLTQIADVKRKRERLEEMNRRYREYLAEVESISLFKRAPSNEEELILRVARLFGECELELPEGFVKEVKVYIEKWRSSPRFLRALERLENNGTKDKILQAMTNEGVPAQFLYLALQESNFKHDAVGPETRFGIAKGAWQFIPGTAADYGLKVGPLASVPKFDPDDERFDFEKATSAAARYLKDIYAGEAQASGLLVMASYNWGHNRVRKLIRKMPDNPRDRNFWQLINSYRIPKETYDYVFYIFSAAVIGEDPERFGFKFVNPLV